MKCRETSLKSKNYISGSDRLTLIPSYKCNLACPDCKVGNAVAATNSANELHISHFQNFIDVSGSKNVNITGGEPLFGTTKERTYAIVEKALQSKVHSILINTNGTVPIPDFDFESSDTVIEFCVSLDGSQEKHDAHRGEGAFDAAVTFMQTMLERGYMISSHYIINGIPNASEIASYIGFIRSNRLVNSPVSFRWFRNMGLAESEGDCFIKQYYLNSTFPKENFRSFLEKEGIALEYVLQCKYDSRKHSYTVNPNGDIIPCQNRGETGPVFGNIASFNYTEVQANMKAFFDAANCYGLEETGCIIEGNGTGKGNPNFKSMFYKE